MKAAKKRAKRTPRMSRPFSAILVCAIVLCALMLFALVFVPQRIVEQQVNDNMLSILGGVAQQIDHVLYQVQQDTCVLAVNDAQIRSLNAARDPLETYNIKAALLKRLIDSLTVNKGVSGYVVYACANEACVNASRPEANYEENSFYRQVVLDVCGESREELSRLDSNYRLLRHGDRYCLASMIYSNDIIASAFIDLNRFAMLFYDTSGKAQGRLVFVDPEGKALNDAEGDLDYRALTLKGKSGRGVAIQNGYHVAGVQLQNCSLKVLLVQPSVTLNRGFNRLLLLLGICEAVLILFVGVAALSIRRAVLKPINQVVNGLKEIAKGDLDTKLEMSSHYQEMDELIETFNSTMGQLDQISTKYSQKLLDEQRVILQYRQLQIQPHFLYNSLNTICTLIRVGQPAAASEFCEYLVAYFRYLLTDIYQMVPVRLEINHLRNSMNIYEFRMPDRLYVKFDVEEQALECLIPPLLIHTLFENTIKHAASEDEPTMISLEIFTEVHEGEEYLHILLSDSGEGFPPEVLEHLNSAGQTPWPDGNPHIGLENIRQRMRLMFSGREKCSFYNLEGGGACNDLLMPAVYGKEE